MKAISVAGYVLITFIMLVMTIQTHRDQQAAGAGAGGAANQMLFASYRGGR